jgi:hypothetical protein
MISEDMIFNWPPPFTDQWATTYLQVLFQGFLFALGVPTAIYSLIVDDDIKRVAQTRVKARRYFMVTGLLYAAAFILVWFIHPSPEQQPYYTIAQQEVPTPATTPQTSQTPEPSPMGKLSYPFVQSNGNGTEQTAAQQQTPTDPTAVRQDEPEQKVLRQDAPREGTAGQTGSPQPRQPATPPPSWSLIIKSTFAAATVTILPFGVLIMGLRLNRQFKRSEVIARLADTLLETFENEGILDAVAIGDLSYLGEHGKAGEEKGLVLDVIDRLAERVQDKVKDENVPYHGFELEILIRHIPIMLDNTIQPGNDQNYRRAAEVLANIWRWLSMRRRVTDDALSTRETLRHLSLQAVNRTGEETALTFLEIAADCDGHLVFEIGLTAVESHKYLLAAAAFSKLEAIASDAIVRNRAPEVQRETIADLLGMTAHFATAGPAGFRRAETALQLNEELFAPTLRNALTDAFDYHYDDGRYETADKISLLVAEADKMKAVALDRHVQAHIPKPDDTNNSIQPEAKN